MQQYWSGISSYGPSTCSPAQAVLILDGLTVNVTQPFKH